MKKILLLLPLLLLALLVGCSKVEVNANMYEIKDWVYEQEVKDYKYEILNNYEDYQNNKNHDSLHNYEEEYFNNHVILILYIRDSTSGNRFGLKEVSKTNSNLTIYVEYIEYGMDQAFSTTVYCVEVESKGIKKVEVKRITKETKEILLTSDYLRYIGKKMRFIGDIEE